IVVYCKTNYVKLRTYPIFACYFIRRLRSTKAKLSRSCASPKSCPILVIFLLNSRFNQWNAMVGWRMLSFNFQFLEAPYCTAHLSPSILVTCLIQRSLLLMMFPVSFCPVLSFPYLLVCNLVPSRGLEILNMALGNLILSTSASGTSKQTVIMQEDQSTKKPVTQRSGA